MRFLGHIFSLLVLVGLLGLGGVIGAIWWYGRDLPDHAQLADYQPPELSKVYAADGAPVAEFARERRIFAPIADIPPLVRNAFISAEDKRFYSHPGVDPIALGNAVLGAARGGRMRGASTITQQVVKVMLVGDEREVERKIREAILAFRLERAISKDQILEIYLNQIYLGAGANGVATAAQTYFGKSLAELEPEEAAYLAALPQRPSQLHPVRNKEIATNRRNYVLREMRDNNFITAEQAEKALAKPLETRLDDPTARRAPEAYDWAMAYPIEDIRSELISRFGEEAAYGGGLVVRSSIDPTYQALAGRALREGLSDFDRRDGWRGPVGRVEGVAAMDEEARRKALAEIRTPRDLGDWRLGVIISVGEKAAKFAPEPREGQDSAALELTLESVRWARQRRENGSLGAAPKAVSDALKVGDVVYVAPVDPKANGGASWQLRQIPNVNGALVAMDPHTGRVLAMQGGFSAQASAFNRATQAKRQPGSAFKPIIYAAALDHGYTPATVVLDAPVSVDQGGGQGVWRPENFSRRFNGPTPVRVGLERSYNAITVRMAQDIGMDVIGDYAIRMGVYDSMPNLLAYALGSGETTLMRLAAAYSIIANGGERVKPSLIDRVQDRNGVTLMRADDRPCADCAAAAPDSDPPHPQPREQVLDPVTAYQTSSMMEGVILRGTATRLRRLGHPLAGKTGTTNDAKDAWFIGYTPDLLLGCFMGFDTPQELGKEASGGGLCGPVFEIFMGEALKGEAPKAFTPPETGISLVRIDRRTGQRMPEGVTSEDMILEVFRTGTEPEDDESYTPSADIFAPPVGEMGYGFDDGSIGGAGGGSWSGWAPNVSGGYAPTPAPTPYPSNVNLGAPLLDVNGRPVGYQPPAPPPSWPTQPDGTIYVDAYGRPVQTATPQPALPGVSEYHMDPVTGQLIPVAPPGGFPAPQPQYQQPQPQFQQPQAQPRFYGQPPQGQPPQPQQFQPPQGQPRFYGEQPQPSQPFQQPQGAAAQAGAEGGFRLDGLY